MMDDLNEIKDKQANIRADVVLQYTPDLCICHVMFNI